MLLVSLTLIFIMFIKTFLTFGVFSNIISDCIYNLTFLALQILPFSNWEEDIVIIGRVMMRFSALYLIIQSRFLALQLLFNMCIFMWLWFDYTFLMRSLNFIICIFWVRFLWFDFLIIIFYCWWSLALFIIVDILVNQVGLDWLYWFSIWVLNFILDLQRFNTVCSYYFYFVLAFFSFLLDCFIRL